MLPCPSVAEHPSHLIVTSGKVEAEIVIQLAIGFHQEKAELNHEGHEDPFSQYLRNSSKAHVELAGVFSSVWQL